MKTIILFLLFLSNCNSTTNNTKTDSMTNATIVNLVQNNDLVGAKTALENGAAVNATDGQESSLLLIATRNSFTEMAKLLVSFKADVNQQSTNLDSAFLYAGASGQTELVELYLANGARFDVFNRYYGSALIPACERGHIETVRLLANTKNYPIDHVNKLGWTALMEAIVLSDGSEKFQQIIEILKKAGAKMDIPDHDGITPIQHAKSRGFNEIVKILSS